MHNKSHTTFVWHNPKKSTLFLRRNDFFSTWANSIQEKWARHFKSIIIMWANQVALLLSTSAFKQTIIVYLMHWAHSNAFFPPVCGNHILGGGFCLNWRVLLIETAKENLYNYLPGLTRTGNGCWNKISCVTFLWFLLWQKRLAMTFNFQDIKKISKGEGNGQNSFGAQQNYK